jgi:hypothetical protein
MLPNAYDFKRIINVAIYPPWMPCSPHHLQDGHPVVVI